MFSVFLDKNENRYPHSPLVLSYLKEISEESLSSYKPSAEPLIQKFSELYDIPEESLILGNGGEEILKSAVEITVRAGDRVLLPQGGWGYYEKLVRQAGGEVHFFPIQENGREYFWPLADICKSMEVNRPRMVVLASPNNPTGHAMSLEEIEEVLDLAKITDTLVILDEAYFGFGVKSLSYLGIREKYPQLLVVRTLSKFFSLAGLRMGFGIWGARWKKLGDRYQRYLGFSHLSSDIALKVLESFEHYQGNAEKMILERESLTDFFRSQGISVYNSQANFLLCRLEPRLFLQSQEVFPKRGVKIKFFQKQQEPTFESCVRITIGLESQNSLVREIFSDILN